MATITLGNRTIYIPESDSPCDTWRAYFDKLKDWVGKDHAKILWLITWKKHGSTSCTTNADFNTFLRKQGIDVSTAATRAVADLSEIGGSILGMGKNMSKLFAIGIPVLMGSILIVIILLLLRAAKSADLIDIAMLASGPGRAVMAAKHVSK